MGHSFITNSLLPGRILALPAFDRIAADKPGQFASTCAKLWAHGARAPGRHGFEEPTGRFLPPFTFAPVRCWRAGLATSATEQEQSKPATAAAGKAMPELVQITGLFQRAGALNPDADCFDCGGQSLTAASLCADLRHEQGIEI
jgi:hypothetical protein